jgi:hypothetical protein
MESKIISIKNFNLNVFKHLLDQSLIVNNQLMLEFANDLVKAVSFSPSASLLKLWTIPFMSLIKDVEQVIPVPTTEPKSKDSKDNEAIFDGVLPGFEDELAKQTIQQHKELQNIPKFNFYVLKGDLFAKYLSVHNADIVDVEFSLETQNGKMYASTIKIIGKSENGSPLETLFILTTEELITSKVSDYSEIINECTPDDSMDRIIVTSEQIQEVKRFVKRLHKSMVDNTAYLSFDISEKMIVVKDKVFNVKFNIDAELKAKANLLKSGNDMNFNILKSDFVMLGNHTFDIYSSNECDRVIFGTNYAGAIIWCVSTKVNEQNISLDNSENLNNALDALEISEYL